MLRRGQKLAVVVAAVGVAAVAGVSWPRALSTDDIAGGARPSGAAGTSPTITFAPATTVPPDPGPPDPGPTADVAGAPGRTLRVGFAPAARTPTLVADAVGSRVGLYSEPGQDEPDGWFDNPTWEGLPAVFIVHDRYQDWLRVQVSMRPNGATAWVRAGEVTTREVTSRVEVDTHNATLRAYEGSRLVLEASVAPGKGATPTPLGHFFVDGIVKINDPWGPYGAFQVSVSGFSEVYSSFGGGVGQIAIHGTNDPALIGTPASNGCVRMTNPDITALAGIFTIGTPVTIT